MSNKLKLSLFLITLPMLIFQFSAHKALSMNFTPGANDRLKQIIKGDEPETASLEEVEKLLQAGANPNRFLDRLCPSYLHLLADKDKYSSLIEVLLKNGALPNLRNYYKETPLHIAAKNGALQTVALLLKHHAMVNALDDNNHTPLYSILAKKLAENIDDERFFTCAKTLVESGAALPDSLVKKIRKNHKFIIFLNTRELRAKLQTVKQDKLVPTFLARLPSELIEEIVRYATYTVEGNDSIKTSN